MLHARKKFPSSLLEGGNETNEPDLILKKQEEFLSNLYKSKSPCVENSDCDIFFNSVDLTTLTEQMSSSCEGVITEHECL